MVLEARGRCLPLSRAPVSERDAFAIFDDAHCRGADLKVGPARGIGRGSARSAGVGPARSLMLSMCAALSVEPAGSRTSGKRNLAV